MEDLAEIKSLLSQPQRVAVTMHLRPDGDAIGSSLGLAHWLKALGHKVQVISPTDFPGYLAWMPGANDMLIGPEDPERANWAFEGADAIFCLDFNDPKRVAEFEPALMASPAQRVMIDHHLEPKSFYHLRFWDDSASSAAELVFRLWEALDSGAPLLYDMAVCLYVGLMTDTGSFRYSATTPEVHRIAARLLETGIPVQEVHDLIYATNTAERIRFTGYVISNCLVHLPAFRTAYLKVDKSVFRKFNVRTGDTEGLVNYPMSLSGVDLAILMTEQEGLIKLSIRSRNGVSSQKMGEHFGGGGHLYAAGGKSAASMDETEQRIKAYLESMMGPADPQNAPEA